MGMLDFFYSGRRVFFRRAAEFIGKYGKLVRIG
jgi:hypothetical protein